MKQQWRKINGYKARQRIPSRTTAQRSTEALELAGPTGDWSFMTMTTMMMMMRGSGTQISTHPPPAPFSHPLVSQSPPLLPAPRAILLRSALLLLRRPLSTEMSLSPAAQAAVDAVVKASRVCESVRTGGLLQAVDKADKSPVTVADFAAQASAAAFSPRRCPWSGACHYRQERERRKKKRPKDDPLLPPLSFFLEERGASRFALDSPLPS